jgi:hypothetical protein
MNSLIHSAGFNSTQIAKQSIWIEAFYLYELSLAGSPSVSQIPSAGG